MRFGRRSSRRFDLSLGTGLGKLAGRVFRIGHLGCFNDLMLCGTLCGVEMGLALRGVPHRKGGVGDGARLPATSRNKYDDDGAQPAAVSSPRRHNDMTWRRNR